MILTDDNFATIVGAVEYGRIIYDNLLKYLRLQMASLFGFIPAFLAAAAFGVTLVLFGPLQILFVNYFVQGPIGASLGFDSPTQGLMKRKSRPADQKIFSPSMVIRLVLVGAVAAIFTIAVYQWTKDDTGSTSAAQTVAIVMFSILALPISISLRHPFDSVFRAETFSNKYLLFAYRWILLVLMLVTVIPLLQRIFETESMTLPQWGVCLAGSVIFIVVSEIIKVLLRLAKVGR
jgi:Ca2+-transporting ATPase